MLWPSKFQMACASHTGKIREHNEDNILFNHFFLEQEHQSMERTLLWEGPLSDRPIAAVFDGMGGESLGELASYTAAQTLSSLPLPDAWSAKSLTRQTIALNRKVYEAGLAQKVRQIGSTALLLALDEKQAWICNLGDSPGYKIRRRKMSLVTHAHTNEEFLKAHGVKNRKPGLTQFLGISEEEFTPEPYITAQKLHKGMIFLLCSDGLTDMVAENEIRGIILRQRSLEQCAENLLNAALQNGGIDNITIILCKIY